MCGISILINTKQREIPMEMLQKMNDTIVHRGPDDSGIFVDRNIGFGHRRLSILDLSSAGHQPMTYRQYTITYNGEVYNYIELRKELERKGHVFKSNTDTEVILAAYSEWGKESFRRFNGMWAFAIYDSENKEVVLCRDHFGIKPLQYTFTGDFFAAFSETKQAFTLPSFRSQLNITTASAFLAHGSLNQSTATFFENVYELAAGHYLSYSLDENKSKINRWYSLAETPSMDPGRITFDDAAAEIYRLLTYSLKIRIRSDVKVGSCLSGGIDSSAIVTTLFNNRMVGNDFTTVTCCYSDLAYDERRFSEKVTTLTKYPSVLTFPDLNSLLNDELLDQINYHQDQPIPSASHFSEYAVFKAAREHNITVMLDGQGSDEYFGGYGEFIRQRIVELFKTLRFRKALNVLKEKAANQHTTLGNECKKLINHYLRQNSTRDLTFLNPQIRKLAGADHSNKSYSSIRELSLTELQSTSLPYQLHSEDRNSMMFSVESRLPYLDHELVQFVISLPSEFKVKGATTKKILREAIPSLPEEIRNRTDKMGFVAPDKLWFIENGKNMHPLMKKVQSELDVLLSPAFPGLFESDIINQRNYHARYFRVLSFYSWFKKFNPNINA